MTRDLLARQIAERTGDSLIRARKTVDLVLEEVTRAVLTGKEVRLSDFGTFKLKQRAERMANNPATGEKVFVPAKQVVDFKPAPSIVTALNEQGL